MQPSSLIYRQIVNKAVIVAFSSLMILGGVQIALGANSSSFTQVILPDDSSITLLDEADEPIIAPTIPIEVTFSAQPQQMITTLGTAQQKIRIINPSFDTPWNVALAATAGAGALWTNGVNTYDYNDINANGLDGPDIDLAGGQLIIDPSSGVIHPVVNLDNCLASDLSLGGLSTFEEATTSSITVISSAMQHASYCQWDLTNITVQQIVPGGQTAGGYQMDFTLTII